MTNTPIPGDPVYLGSFLANTHWYGVVGDGETPAMQVATMEAVSQDAVICLDALKGEKGDDGKPADIVKMQWDSTITNASQLPTNLNTTTDVGKAWWIGNLVYAWTGSHFVAKAMGSPGQPGETPHITVTTELLAPGSTSTVVQSGTSLNPVLNFKIAAPRGPAGPAASITAAQDYDNTLPPTAGQVPTWNGTKNKWEPSDFAARHPRLYSVPESAFSNANTLATNVTILSYTVPAQDYDWVPHVTGHFKAFGLELLDSDPLTIGSEVRLGDPNSGQLIGRGFGNITGWSHITPHFSSAGNSSMTVAPDNGVAMVSAGQPAVISVRLVNDGMIGYYQFDKAGAQLTILTVPQG